ncbi:type II secretion system protein H [Tepidimonas sediminis]|uniref:Type II secretion system protein H n=1 Tax=Tepidimonas sediminis TaxID=2588941 RepID=A0A554WSE6_9BURK|nr:GspH/FimT family pseudopilin [Tepidimonas sediminis]TSE26499.1 type II secretion system protein H [Tepidimonas sediminis]
MGRRGRSRRRGRGLTLIELLVGLAVLALLAGAGAPAWSGWQQRARLRATAELLAADLRHAQSEAAKRHLTLGVTAQADAHGWCLGFHAGSDACDCHQPGACHVDGVERVRRGADHPGVALAVGVSGGTFWFGPRRGTATAGHLTLSLADGHAVRVVVHGVGRVRLCRPVGTPDHGGLETC